MEDEALSFKRERMRAASFELQLDPSQQVGEDIVERRREERGDETDDAVEQRQPENRVDRPGDLRHGNRSDALQHHGRLLEVLRARRTEPTQLPDAPPAIAN